MPLLPAPPRIFIRLQCTVARSESAASAAKAREVLVRICQQYLQHPKALVQVCGGLAATAGGRRWYMAARLGVAAAALPPACQLQAPLPACPLQCARNVFLGVPLVNMIGAALPHRDAFKVCADGRCTLHPPAPAAPPCLQQA